MIRRRWTAAREKGLIDALCIVARAFVEQMTWWGHIPLLGLIVVKRRDKRIEKYLQKQITENHYAKYFPQEDDK